MASHRSSALPAHQDARLRRDDEAAASKPGTARRDASPAPAADASMQESLVPSPAATLLPRRNIVLPDPVAFRFLEEDSCAQVVEQRSVLQGYELYLVEQWACSRQSPTLVIATYTGDETHSITVGVLAVPEDEALWSSRLRVYLKAAQQHHARPKPTDLGELLVTNLSSFPSALSVIPIPDGDVRKHRQLFIANEDLKRLGCSGRSGLTLTEPPEATQAKFHQLYRTSDRVPFLQSVTELIKLCQVALYMFEKLESEYIDGLLCDVTETAIADWWTEVGAEHYNFEPTDGILGPSTVAALLGMLMGARNRLHWYGAPVSKDVFDIENTKRGVAYFQKQLKLDKTRRLDRQTLFRLHTATAKAASGEGWGVHKAVKSTVSEIGGKRGEIVMDMVSGRDKAGLADIETLDIDTFANLAYGERAKWLWHGKPRRATFEHVDYDQDLGGTILTKHDTAGQAAKRTQSLPLDDDLETRRRDDGSAPYSTFPPGPLSMADHAGDRDALRRNVFKSVAGKMNDARSGLGRIKDAVGGSRRGHASRPSITTKEDVWGSGNAGATVAAGAAQAPAMTSSPAIVLSNTGAKSVPDESPAGSRRGDADAWTPSSHHNGDASGSHSDPKRPADEGPTDSECMLNSIGLVMRKDMLPEAVSRAHPVASENDLEGPLLDAERRCDGGQLAVSRRHSIGVAQAAHRRALNENRWARRMSFGDAEPAILTWSEIADDMDTTGEAKLAGSRAGEDGNLGRLIDDVLLGAKPWVEAQVNKVQTLNEAYVRDSAELQSLYHQLNEACQRVHKDADGLLAVERGIVGEGIKEVEVLFARLEYEVDSLAQKANDVEDGIRDFERQVDGVEKRAGELKEQLETESWLHWFVRTLTGVGTGPNITRETG